MEKGLEENDIITTTTHILTVTVEHLFEARRQKNKQCAKNQQSEINSLETQILENPIETQLFRFRVKEFECRRIICVLNTNCGVEGKRRVSSVAQNLPPKVIEVRAMAVAHALTMDHQGHGPTIGHGPQFSIQYSQHKA